tara:strand:- start:5250 stop:6125 length:876 start_codon:yes stop_codon:yes gene_type:complete
VTVEENDEPFFDRVFVGSFMDAQVADAGILLIGLGPGDLDLMSVQAIEAAKMSDHRFLEGYTATMPPDQEARLEELVGPWSRLMRTEVENPNDILELAGDSVVALMVVGDPMQATTHVDLVLRASEAGVKTKIIPGISAVSLAVSYSGLQSYRFGRQVTLPYPYRDYLPTSPLVKIKLNRSQNLHTLLLLDLDPTGMGVDRPQPMDPSQALDILLMMEEKEAMSKGSQQGLDESILDLDAILMTDLGCSSQSIVSGSLEDISKLKRGRIHSLVLPAIMDPLEEAYFKRIKI